MDPNCAVCGLSALAACECEAASLDRAIKSAEARVMHAVYQDIRQWARSHAQDSILDHFRHLTDLRKSAHAAHLERLRQNSLSMYNLEPSPAELHAAQQVMKRGIDQDWRDSVSLYPEVLEYYFSLVELSLPPDSSPAVKSPPFLQVPAQRKPPRRPLSLTNPVAAAAAAAAAGPPNLPYIDMPARGHPRALMPPPDTHPLPRRASTPPHRPQMLIRRPISPPSHLDRRTPNPTMPNPASASVNRERLRERDRERDERMMHMGMTRRPAYQAQRGPGPTPPAGYYGY